MNTWSHLPNSHHIDWVIESVKQNPKVWREAWRCMPVRGAVLIAAWNVANDMTRGTAVYDAAAAIEKRLLAYAGRWTATRQAAENTILALVAYDDCDQYINMGYEKLQVYATLSEKPQAILLLPMVYVREKTKDLEIQFERVS